MKQNRIPRRRRAMFGEGLAAAEVQPVSRPKSWNSGNAVITEMPFRQVREGISEQGLLVEIGSDPKRWISITECTNSDPGPGIVLECSLHEKGSTDEDLFSQLARIGLEVIRKIQGRKDRQTKGVGLWTASTHDPEGEIEINLPSSCSPDEIAQLATNQGMAVPFVFRDLADDESGQEACSVSVDLSVLDEDENAAYAIITIPAEWASLFTRELIEEVIDVTRRSLPEANCRVELIDWLDRALKKLSLIPN